MVAGDRDRENNSLSLREYSTLYYFKSTYLLISRIDRKGVVGIPALGCYRGWKDGKVYVSFRFGSLVSVFQFIGLFFLVRWYWLV
ncbi:hypothetical protein BDQ94DRAFT_150297 [Aspergillus welwitschiae]|uniref:Uncharacterized protein n=1 Tax=Aspergillus welwitschiae TaxID=1341132 RepID=A0A3F3PR91_9EURO|nr:hypothetical protein BDQ94DRAFT_150297 [Aspergillus welwitschiae]RDH29460.1 hypothetical protein BDQ94DRAFT_150297 [Aspergillus welwitschiae]